MGAQPPLFPNHSQGTSEQEKSGARGMSAFFFFVGPLDKPRTASRVCGVGEEKGQKITSVVLEEAVGKPPDRLHFPLKATLI